MKNLSSLLVGSFILSGLSFSVLTSCGSNQAATEADTLTAAVSITGKWTKPIAGQAEKMEGFQLNEDGTAASINMATLQYEAWERKGDTLLLSGKSMGNGQTIDFTDTLTISAFSADSMTLTRGNLAVTYHHK